MARISCVKDDGTYHANVVDENGNSIGPGIATKLKKAGEVGKYRCDDCGKKVFIFNHTIRNLVISEAPHFVAERVTKSGPVDLEPYTQQKLGIVEILYNQLKKTKDFDFVERDCEITSQDGKKKYKVNLYAQRGNKGFVFTVETHQLGKSDTYRRARDYGNRCKFISDGLEKKILLKDGEEKPIPNKVFTNIVLAKNDWFYSKEDGHVKLKPAQFYELMDFYNNENLYFNPETKKLELIIFSEPIPRREPGKENHNAELRDEDKTITLDDFTFEPFVAGTTKKYYENWVTKNLSLKIHQWRIAKPAKVIFVDDIPFYVERFGRKDRFVHQLEERLKEKYGIEDLYPKDVISAANRSFQIFETKKNDLQSYDIANFLLKGDFGKLFKGKGENFIMNTLDSFIVNNEINERNYERIYEMSLKRILEGSDLENTDRLPGMPSMDPLFFLYSLQNRVRKLKEKGFGSIAIKYSLFLKAFLEDIYKKPVKTDDVNQILIFDN